MPELSPEPLLRAYEATVDDASASDRSLVAKINTAAIDRFKTLIPARGGDLRAFTKNPIVLWEHGLDPNRTTVPIGKNLWIKVDKAREIITAKTRFASDEFSEDLWQLYREGYLKGFSIRAMPTAGTYGPPTPAEIKARPELVNCQCVYRSWTLVEYSAVAIPGNPECLTEAVERGFWLPDQLRAMVPKRPSARKPEPKPAPKPDLKLPPLVGVTSEEIRRAVQAQLARDYGPGRMAEIREDLFALAKGQI